jgi:hypothetical protein
LSFFVDGVALCDAISNLGTQGAYFAQNPPYEWGFWTAGRCACMITLMGGYALLSSLTVVAFFR